MSITLVFPSDGCLCCFFHTICHCPPLVGSHPFFLSPFFSFFPSSLMAAEWHFGEPLPVEVLDRRPWLCEVNPGLFIHLSVCLMWLARCENGCQRSSLTHTAQRSHGREMKERTRQVQRWRSHRCRNHRIEIDSTCVKIRETQEFGGLWCRFTKRGLWVWSQRWRL